MLTRKVFLKKIILYFTPKNWWMFKMHKSHWNKGFVRAAWWGWLCLVSGLRNNRILSVFNAVAATLMGTNVTTCIFIIALCSIWRFSCCHLQDETIPNLVNVFLLLVTVTSAVCSVFYWKWQELRWYTWEHFKCEGLYTDAGWQSPNEALYSSFWWVCGVCVLFLLQCQHFIFSAEQSHHVVTKSSLFVQVPSLCIKGSQILGYSSTIKSQKLWWVIFLNTKMLD